MSHRVPAAALLLALAWGVFGGERAQAGVVTPELSVRQTFDASPGPTAPPSEAPAIDRGEGGSTGAPAPVPAVHPGAALPADPIQVVGDTLSTTIPLPNRCLRPLLYPGGIFRPPRCV